MNVTVTFTDAELAEIARVTGEPRKGTALRLLVLEALDQRRRIELSEKFLTGEWGVDLKGYESLPDADPILAPLAPDVPHAPTSGERGQG
jgi:hypothetical protein